MSWLKANGAPPQGLMLKTIQDPSGLFPTTSASSQTNSSSSNGRNGTDVSSSVMSSPGGASVPPIDMAVAARPLQPGDVALFMPEHLVITLDRVFESEFVAELLTAGKLSELAALALFLMYEKKLGKESFYRPYIRELDRQRARGATLAVESPLLWDESELEDLLQGSPLLSTVKQRVAGIQKEYEELDTVWFMAGSLFNKYPFDLPTETFSYEVFKQAFAAVQASIVHLQGMPLARRFALVPLGPPLLSYSSASRAMLTYNIDQKGVELKVDREYAEGEPVTAWCGPQPNTRLLLNYGLVDESNAWDKLQITAIIASTDPLFQLKKATLQANQLATAQTFDLAKNKPLPPMLLPYMRLAMANTVQELQQVAFGPTTARPVGPEQEAAVLAQLSTAIQRRLQAYKFPVTKDIEVMADPAASPRQKVAARLCKIEKEILLESLEQLGGPPSVPAGPLPHLKLT